MTAAQSRSKPLPATAVAVIALIVVGLILFAIFRDRTPPLTRETLETQRRRWAEAQIESYSLELTVQVGSQPPREYELEVENGRVVSFTMEGVPSVRGEAYTVEGIFEIMDRELTMLEGGPGEPGIPEALALRAEFDQETGLPRAFTRIAARNQSFFIRIRRFARR